MRLLVADDAHPGLFLCPFCQGTFRLPGRSHARQLLVAVDVSTSSIPFLADMQREMVELHSRKAGGGGCQMRVYTFHRELQPFPCEHLCRPQPGESIILPTLRDLRGRLAPGSAVLDALYQLLREAETPPGEMCEVVMMTDGVERNSCRHPEEVRRRIRRVPGNTNIHIVGFTNASPSNPITQLVRLLATSRVMWSFRAASRPRLVCSSSSSHGSSAISYSRGHEKCHI